MTNKMTDKPSNSQTDCQKVRVTKKPKMKTLHKKQRKIIKFFKRTGHHGRKMHSFSRLASSINCADTACLEEKEPMTSLELVALYRWAHPNAWLPTKLKKKILRKPFPIPEKNLYFDKFYGRKSVFCQILRVKNLYILIKISMSGRSVRDVRWLRNLSYETTVAALVTIPSPLSDATAAPRSNPVSV